MPYGIELGGDLLCIHAERSALDVVDRGSGFGVIAEDLELPDTGISIQWERALSAQFIQMEQYGTRAKTIVLQHRSGKTQVCEIRYDQSGFIEENNFTLQLPLFGGP